MSQVEESFKCPKCGGEACYVIDINTYEEWCGCLEPNCDYGWKHIKNPETGKLEEIVGKVAFYQIPYSKLHPIEQLPMQIAIDALDIED